jgi:Fe-S-cluster containining protein
MKIECNQCGRCCKEVTINVSQTDILRWKEEDRTDILKEVSWVNNYPRKNTGGFYIAKTTFNPKQSCPFYKDDVCSIHDTKPKACKDYPFSQSRIFPECFLFELEGKFILRREKIKKSQYKDFKKAFDNQGRLMPILIEARH